MDVGQIINGFKVLKETELKDIDSILYELEHIKTGAGLCFVKNDDNNKTFSITFKTLPSNNTGVFHILEHCVLNGSKKYPVKEPFVELLKSSMQTFLNAMTAPDYTTYPVSSRNDKDFMNLMAVYLDAVFNPLIYENPNIFYQEGWHYEIDEEGNLIYNGVVFNEMKGAYSSIDDTLINNINSTLFPNNCYQYDSGGNPENITDLTYEEFINTHKKFYHPSNARIILDGAINNIEEILAFIDEEYLSKYEKEKKDFDIEFQEEVDAKVIKYDYELSKDNPLENRTVITLAKIVSKYDDVVQNMAWHLICEYLVSNNESKFSKAIIDKGLAEDVEFDLIDNPMQPWAVLVLRNTEEDKLEEALTIIKEATKEIMNEGFDKKKLLASLNRLEFKIKEKKELAGLTHSQSIIKSWLHNGDPANNLYYSKYIKELKEKMNTSYFEELLESFIFSDKLCTIIAKPSHDLSLERVEKEKDKLKKKREEIDNLDDIRKMNEELKSYQEEGNSEEALKTLPKLTIEDINKEPEDFPYEKERIKAVDVLHYKNDNSGISYLNMYFNLAGITKEYLPDLGFFYSLLTRLDTDKYSVEELQREINTYIGNIKINLEAYMEAEESETCYPVLNIQTSFLNENVDKVIELFLEIIKNTKFTKEKILPLLKQDNEYARQSIITSGHMFANLRVAAHMTSAGSFKEYTSGYESIKHSFRFEKNYEDMIDNFISECELYKEVIFSKDRLTISTNYENNEVIEKLIGSLATIEANKAKVRYPLLKEKKEKYSIPGGVSYVGYGAKIESNKDPLYLLIQHILNYEYLWNEVRVKNGAYGAGVNLRNNGALIAYSYRDPNPINSINAIKNLYKYFDEVDEEMDLTPMIIGALASAEPLSTTKNKILISDTLYFRNITLEERRNNRQAIINATTKDIKEYYEYMKEWLSNNYISVFGSEEILKDMEDYIDIKEE